MATIQTVVEDVCKDIGHPVPDGTFAATDRSAVELARLANKCAFYILEDYDWEVLKREATLTGDGSTTDFDFESDYNRMVKGAELRSSALTAPYTHITDTDEWLMYEVRQLSSVINRWTIYGGQIHVNPAIGSTSTAKYFYISDKIVIPDGETTVSGYTSEFTADDDTFRLDDELLRLCMIWTWKAKKGRPYAEDMANYEIRRAQLVGKNKGSRSIKVGRPRIPKGVTVAYPTTISGS